jgi:hypothetical protein
MTVPAGRRLILVVDADPAFVEDARLLLQGERVLTARSTEEAAEIVAGGRVDVVLLGPSFGSESAVVEAGSLRVADPGVVIVLAANIVTNRILIGAMRSGVATSSTPADTAQAQRRARPNAGPRPLRPSLPTLPRTPACRPRPWPPHRPPSPRWSPYPSKRSRGARRLPCSPPADRHRRGSPPAGRSTSPPPDQERPFPRRGPCPSP